MMRLAKAVTGLLIAFSLAISSEVFAKEELLVYTAVEPELLPAYKDAFEKVYPDVEITYIRDSAGPISARLLAEKEHPKAHVILGLSAIALERLRGAGILEPYQPQNASELNPKMRADD